VPQIISTILDTAIFLFAGEPSQPVGTAFIVGFPIKGREGEAVPLVVTAKHVAADHSRLLGRFSTQSGTSTAFVAYDIPDLKSHGDYWEHSDDGVDIVVFRSPHYQQTKYEAVPFNVIASRDILKEEDIAPSDRIVFPGLLVNFVGSARNYPVLRNGAIALIPEEKVPLRFTVGKRVINTQQEVLFLDATSIPGASGSPVFLWPGPRIKGNAFAIGGGPAYLLGVMHGFLPCGSARDRGS